MATARDPLARYTVLANSGGADRHQLLTALRELADLQSRADKMIDDLILAAGNADVSVRDIGRALGLSSSGSVSKRLERIRAGREPRRHRPGSTPEPGEDG